MKNVRFKKANYRVINIICLYFGKNKTLAYDHIFVNIVDTPVWA